ERLVDHLELVARLVHQASEDHVVSGHRLGFTGTDGLQAVGVLVHGDDVVRVLPDVLLRRRPGDRAGGGVPQRVGPGDVVRVARGNEEALAGDVVRPGEIDDLLAGVVDGVGGDHDVHRAV